MPPVLLGEASDSRLSRTAPQKYTRGETRGEVSNRVLLILPPRQFAYVKVCEGGFCRLKKVEIQPPILKEMAALGQHNWTFGTLPQDHFQIIGIDRSELAYQLFRELNINAQDLPVFVKEFDTSKQKRASGMTAAAVSVLWNTWYVQDSPAMAAQARNATPQCLPTFGSSGNARGWPFYQSIRQHLTDPNAVHHLPEALVKTWTDPQCETWHAWHHDVLEGRIKATRPGR